MGTKEKFKKWVGDAKITVKQKYDAAAKWVIRNKEVVVIAIPVVTSMTTEIVKTIVKHYDIKKEEELKTNYIYDRSKGHYYYMKRGPKPKQWAEIDRRKTNGESYGEILSDMKLLKK